MTDAIFQPLTQQQVFRQLMGCFAYPGRVAEIGADALRALLATLLDGEVSLADPDGLVAAADWSKLETRASSPEAADFVVAAGAKAPAFAPRLGTLESPEKSATLLLRVNALGGGDRYRLSGPGVSHEATLAIDGLDARWVKTRAAWVAAFPLGVDLILVDRTRAAALPRTTRLARTED
jgi:alpha-D-ribose 1-methylphosphonate 5-triphosphate synthase subunit PhnH